MFSTFSFLHELTMFQLAISSDNSNCPADRVRELYDRGDNINEGRGGK